MSIEEILRQMHDHLDDPEWLSKTVVELAGLLYHHNTQMAQAENTEKQVIVALLDKVDSAGKRTSVAEAEKRGVVNTQNVYGIKKAQAEAVVEVINAIKTRLRVLEWERSQNG